MKTIIFSVLTVITLCADTLRAQPTLTAHEKFTPGSSPVNFYVIDTANVSSGATGDAVVWNFANLVQTGSTYTRQYVLPDVTEMGDSFSTATLAEVANDGTTSYLSERNDTTYELGVWLNATGILIKYSRPQVRSVSPQTYKSVCTGTALFQYKYTTYSYKSGGTYTISADSYGTLVLPQGTYNNVVRVRTETLYYDTLQGAGGYVQQVHRVKNSWYNLYNNAPLLEMDSVGIQSPFFTNTRKGVYVHKNPANTVAEVNKETVKAWLNQSTLYIAGLQEEVTMLYLYDATGRLVTKATQNHPSTFAEYMLEQPVTTGIYYVVLPAKTKHYTAKLIVN
jgi:hypothetical protein